MHEYKRWHKALSKELCDYMDCFEDKPSEEALCYAEKVAKTMVKLYELEAYELMFDCLEDCFGYDRDEHEFCDKDGGTDYIMYAIYNAYNPARMTRGTSHYPTMGREYGTGVDHRYGERYDERSTDKSMYPYGMGYGMMNAYDGRGNGNGNGGMTGSRSGGMSGRDGNGRGSSYQNRYMPEDYPDDWYDDDDDERYYMNASRGRGRGGRRRDTRGRYMNMADPEESKKKIKKLSDEEKKRWVSDMENFDGTVGGPWTMQEIESVAKRANIKPDGYSMSDLFVTANMLYSDLGGVISSIPNANKPETYIKLADAWLCDDDGLSGWKKLSEYYNTIVDKDEEDDD